MAKRDKSGIEIDFDTISAFVFILESKIDIIKRDAVEEADDADIEQVTVNTKEVKNIQDTLEKIIKIAKKIIGYIEKDNLLDEKSRIRILTKAGLYRDSAIRILSKVDGLEVVKGKAALKTINSIINDCKELNEAVKI